MFDDFKNRIVAALYHLQKPLNLEIQHPIDSLENKLPLILVVDFDEKLFLFIYSYEVF